MKKKTISVWKPLSKEDVKGFRNQELIEQAGWLFGTSGCSPIIATELVPSKLCRSATKVLLSYSELRLVAQMSASGKVTQFTFDIFKAAFLGETWKGRRRRPVSWSMTHLQTQKIFFTYRLHCSCKKKQNVKRVEKKFFHQLTILPYLRNYRVLTEAFFQNVHETYPK